MTLILSLIIWQTCKQIKYAFHFFSGWKGAKKSHTEAYQVIALFSFSLKNCYNLLKIHCTVFVAIIVPSLEVARRLLRITCITTTLSFHLDALFAHIL